MTSKPPYVCEPADPSKGRPASLIFLHGYGDDAEGLPLGIAQQFQMYNKVQYLRWVLPNAPHNHEALTRAWYVPRALPNAAKPRVPGHEEDEGGEDDQQGIMESVNALDTLVEQELERGIPPERILVGGFSQGCAVSLIWSVTGRMRHKVAGVIALSGYFPLADKIDSIREEKGLEDDGEEKRSWFYVHGSRDMLVPGMMFEQGKLLLARLVGKDRIQDHLYPGMGHSTNPALLRDMLGFFDRVIPP